MYFKPFLIDKILSGDKTQTRRLVKLYASEWSHDDKGNRIEIKKPHCQYKVGQSYAVCPRRGRPVAWYCGTNVIMEDRQYTPATTLAMALGGFQPLRIRITAIRREDSRHINHADAQAEGFQVRGDFLKLWIEMHDPTLYRQLIKRMGPLGYIATDGMWSMRWVEDEELAGMLIKRPAAFYTAWALSFEVER